MPLDRRLVSTLDTDTAPEAVANGRARSLLNVQPERGYSTTVRGTVALPVAYPAGDNHTVGTAELLGTSGGVAWLTWNSEGNHSVARQLPGQAPEVLLVWAGLNLPAPGPATYVPTAVLDSFLLYLDAAGEMRNLPLARLAAGEYPPTRLAAEPWGLHVVKVPPTQPLTPVRVSVSGTDPLYSVKLTPLKAWQFTYRWQYVDGETTVLAPYSAWVDILEAPADATTNAIRLPVPPAPAGVREVDILVRTPGDVGWRVADTLRRTSAGLLPPEFTFYGLSKGAVVQGDDASRLFEALWPSKALASARNRLWYGRPRIGYPTPEPAFTAVVAQGNAGSAEGTLYTLSIERYEPGDPSQNGEPVPDKSVTYTAYYALAAGQYPDADSTYYAVSQAPAPGGAFTYTVVPSLRYTYAQAFATPLDDEYYRQVLVGPVSYRTGDVDLRTFHENSTHRVAVQFYDALGRSAGCSAPVSVAIPRRAAGDTSYRSIQAALTTTDPAALNVEIPAWAVEYQFLVARNDRTIYFIQGEAADVFAFLGNVVEIRPDNTRNEYVSLVDVTKNAHEKVRFDIGNFPATGQGYQWRPGSGDRVRFLREDKDFLITGQVGDYLEVAWTDWPRLSLLNGNSVPLIEIYSPNTTPSSLYYERGPRLAVTRTLVAGVEQRGYSHASVLLEGDCYLVPVSFPTIVKSDEYLDDPSNNKSYQSPKAPTLVESMVPPYRFAPSTTITKTQYDRREKGGFFERLLAPSDRSPFDVVGNLTYPFEADAVTPTDSQLAQVDTAARPAADLLWLDMSYGGRPGVQVPLALQQVELPTAVGFSGARLVGSLLNGLSVWQASDLRELAREQGSVQVLAPANDVPSEDQVLVAVCREGVVSLGVDVARVRQGDGGTITADTSQVIGSISSLRNHLGTRHPHSVTRRDGRLHWWSADQGQFCRYAQDGVNGLNAQHECRLLGQQLAAAYPTATVTAGFDALTQEYILCFGPDEATAAPARTERFSERAGGFVGAAGFHPEALVGTSSQRLVSFVAGQPWEHVVGAPRMRFYGIQDLAEVQVWANQNGSVSKTYLALEVESGATLWVLTRAETPSGQRTRLPATRLRKLEDRWHGALLMDETSPGFSGTDAARRALYEGVPVQGLALLLTLRCADTTPAARLLAVGAEYVINGGQTPPH